MLDIMKYKYSVRKNVTYKLFEADFIFIQNIQKIIEKYTLLFRWTLAEWITKTHWQFLYSAIALLCTCLSNELFLSKMLLINGNSWWETSGDSNRADWSKNNKNRCIWYFSDPTVKSILYKCSISYVELRLNFYKWEQMWFTTISN